MATQNIISKSDMMDLRTLTQHSQDGEAIDRLIDIYMRRLLITGAFNGKSRDIAASIQKELTDNHQVPREFVRKARQIFPHQINPV